MTVIYRTKAVRGHSIDELAEHVATFLNSLEEPPRDWRIAPFVDEYASGDGFYCALVTAEIPVETEL